MIKKLRTRTTDLNVLRSLLSEEEDNKDQDKERDFENKIIFPPKVENKGIHNFENLNVGLSNSCLKDYNDAKKIEYKSKNRDNESPPRKPFYVTRINSHHKDKSSNEVQSDKSNVIYKSIHYNNIVRKEERIQLKYEQLAELLQKDVISRTSAICDQSMNEARQLIQNSLAASRIVSAFVTDSRGSGFVNRTEDTVDNFVQAGPPSSDPFHPPITNMSTSVYGYEVTTPKINSSLRSSTDNRLISEEPFIQQWLQNKERQDEQERRMKRQRWRMERAASMDAERVLEQRKAAAKEAYCSWLRDKSSTGRRVPRSSSIDEDGRPVSVSTADDADDDCGPPQAGRQPRPMHNFVYRRPGPSLVRPRTTATFTTRRDLRLKLTGQRVDLSAAEVSQRLQPCLRATVNRDEPPRQPRRPQTAVPRSRTQDTASAEKSPGRTVSHKSSTRRSRPRLRKENKVCSEVIDQENVVPDSPAHSVDLAFEMGESAKEDLAVSADDECDIYL